MNLSDKIRIIRKARGYSQEDIGYKIGVSRQTISDWENGKFEPTLDSIRAVSKVLDVSFDTLLNERVDLNDKTMLNIALKNLSNDTKGKVNNSFRYRIREYNVSKMDYFWIVCYFIALITFTTTSIVCGIYSNTNFPCLIVAMISSCFAIGLFISLGIIIRKIKKIQLGGSYTSFGTLSQTHFVIIGWSDSSFDRTIYIPVTEIKSMELDKNATHRHGKVIVKVSGRSKPLVTNDIVKPQKLIDVFNNLETFIENSNEF